MLKCKKDKRKKIKKVKRKKIKKVKRKQKMIGRITF